MSDFCTPQRAFPTRYHGTTLVLMVCRDWLWSALYASPHSNTAAEVSVAPSLRATAGERRLVIGGKSYPLSRTSLQSVRRWLDRNGVAVRTAPSPKIFTLRRSMAVKIRSFGRSASLRKLLLDRPEGAAADVLLAAGHLDCTQKQLNDTLRDMCASGQVCEVRKAGVRLWLLSEAMRRLMLTPDATHTASRAAAESMMQASRSISTHATSIQHKEIERQAIAAEIERFRAHGGEIEVLGNTPPRPESTRRQINDAAAIFRSLDFCKATN